MTPISPNANKKKKEGMSTNCLFELPYSSGHLIAWVNRRHLETLPPVSRAKWRLRNERRNCILMTRHYRDLGRASDWFKQISRAARPVRNTTQILLTTAHRFFPLFFLFNLWLVYRIVFVCCDWLTWLIKLNWIESLLSNTCFMILCFVLSLSE